MDAQHMRENFIAGIHTWKIEDRFEVKFTGATEIKDYLTKRCKKKSGTSFRSIGGRISPDSEEIKINVVFHIPKTLDFETVNKPRVQAGTYFSFSVPSGDGKKTTSDNMLIPATLKFHDVENATLSLEWEPENESLVSLKEWLESESNLGTSGSVKFTIFVNANCHIVFVIDSRSDKGNDKIEAEDVMPGELTVYTRKPEEDDSGTSPSWKRPHSLTMDIPKIGKEWITKKISKALGQDPSVPPQKIKIRTDLEPTPNFHLQKKKRYTYHAASWQQGPDDVMKIILSPAATKIIMEALLPNAEYLTRLIYEGVQKLKNNSDQYESDESSHEEPKKRGKGRPKNQKVYPLFSFYHPPELWKMIKKSNKDQLHTASSKREDETDEDKVDSTDSEVEDETHEDEIDWTDADIIVHPPLPQHIRDEEKQQAEHEREELHAKKIKEESKIRDIIASGFNRSREEANNKIKKMEMMIKTKILNTNVKWQHTYEQRRESLEPYLEEQIWSQETNSNIYNKYLRTHKTQHKGGIAIGPLRRSLHPFPAERKVSPSVSENFTRTHDKGIHFIEFEAEFQCQNEFYCPKLKQLNNPSFDMYGIQIRFADQDDPEKNIFPKDARYLHGVNLSNKEINDNLRFLIRFKDDVPNYFHLLREFNFKVVDESKNNEGTTEYRFLFERSKEQLKRFRELYKEGEIEFEHWVDTGDLKDIIQQDSGDGEVGEVNQGTGQEENIQSREFSKRTRMCQLMIENLKESLKNCLDMYKRVFSIQDDADVTELEGMIRQIDEGREPLMHQMQNPRGDGELHAITQKINTVFNRLEKKETNFPSEMRLLEKSMNLLANSFAAVQRWVLHVEKLKTPSQSV
jgi:hypothetical protein